MAQVRVVSKNAGTGHSEDAVLAHAVEMTSHLITAPPQAEAPPRWSRGTHIAFRFCFLYFGLYILCTLLLRLIAPSREGPELGQIPPFSDDRHWRDDELVVPGPQARQLREAYEMFAGGAELTAGILMFVPRLSTLGALICLADTTEVFVLNMSYDVPVKLFSFHLLLVSLVLLAPETSRLINVLVLNRTAEPSTQPPLVNGRRAIQLALAAQLVFGAYAVGMNLHGAADRWNRYGGGAPKSPLYGIWNVDEMSIDNVEDRTLTLSKANDKSWTAHFAFQRSASERLLLDGDMDGHKVRMQLQLFDRNKSLLVNRGFHWIQEYPFNR